MLNKLLWMFHICEAWLFYNAYAETEEHYNSFFLLLNKINENLG